MSLKSEASFKFKPFEGDDCGFGYNLANSETRFHSLQMSHYILRYICSNGAIVRLGNEGRKALVHYGYSKDFAFEYINESLDEIANSQINIAEKLTKLKNFTTEEVMQAILCFFFR